MNDDSKFSERLKDLDLIIQNENLLFLFVSLFFTAGSIYLVYYNEFTEVPYSFIFFNFIIFLTIYVIFFKFKKELKLKILRKIDYVLFGLKIDKDLENLKKEISDFSFYFRNNSDTKKMNKVFNKLITDRYDFYESKTDKMISEFRSLKVEAGRNRNNIEPNFENSFFQ